MRERERMSLCECGCVRGRERIPNSVEKLSSPQRIITADQKLSKRKKRSDALNR